MRMGRIAATWRGFDRFERLFLPGFFVLFSLLARLFPYSGDDWAWGSQIGLDRLQSLFVGYNGRFAGNFAVLLLTRMGVFGRITVAAVVTVSLFLILDLAGNRTRQGYLLVSALFLAMPLALWRESVVWLSGFSNYALAGLCVLIYLRSVRRIFTNGETSRSTAHYAALLVFGITAALLIEHVTLYLIVASVVFLIAYRIRFARLSLDGVAWTVSFVGAAVLMFSNGAYRTAAVAGTGYQSIGVAETGSVTKDLVVRVMNEIAGQAVTANSALNVAIVVLLCLIAGSAATNAVGSRWERYAVVGLAGAFSLLAYRLRVAAPAAEPGVATLSLYGVAALFLLAAIVLAARRLVGDGADRWLLWGACASIVVMLAPLALANPIGPRCFYPTYLLMLVIVGVLDKHVAASIGDRVGPGVDVFLGIAVVALLAANLFVYGVIARAASTRIGSIRSQVAAGATTVEVKRLPYKDYVHMPDPLRRPWDYRYKLFNHLPDRLVIEQK